MIAEALLRVGDCRRTTAADRAMRAFSRKCVPLYLQCFHPGGGGGSLGPEEGQERGIVSITASPEIIRCSLKMHILAIR